MASSPPPLVSVIVPAWPEDRDAEATLRSVQNQDHEAIEIIVVDDCSRPGGGGAIRRYLEREDVRARFRRTVFIEERGPLSASHAANAGLREAQGDYVNLLEAGDTLAPRRFSRLLSVCTEHHAEIAFSRAEPGGAAPAAASGEVAYRYSIQDDIEFFPTVGYALFRSPCVIAAANLFFSRRLAGQVGGFDHDGRSCGWDFALRCLLVTEPMFVPETLYYYRLRGLEDVQETAEVSRENETVLKNYLFLCRNRPVLNPFAPSPAWGPFFEAFLEASRYSRLLAQP